MEAMMNHLALRFIPLMLLSLLAESLGGEGSATVAVDASESRPDDQESQKALAKLGGSLDWDGADDVWKIEFRGKPVTDADLEHIRGLHRLEILDLTGTKITDGALAKLESQRCLRNLNLDGTRVTDAGMVYLQKLPSLAFLSLNSTAVSDTGLAHLKSIKSLEGLDLNGTKATDAGLVHLEVLGKLDHLTLKNTRVNEEGVKRLRTALPKLSWVEYDTPPFDRAGAEAANRILEKVKAGDLQGFRAIVEQDPAAVHLRWTGFFKGDDGDGLTALFFATRRGDLPMVKFLLAHGADAKAGNAIGDTPLHFAPTVEIATALIAAGADVGAKGNCGYTPLHYARTRGIAEVLLAHGADVDAQSVVSGSDFGTQRSPDKKPSVRSTPLCWAARDGRLDVVLLLIEHGADVNADAQDGAPLYQAAQRGHAQIVEVLLAKGARVNAADGRNSPLYGAAENGHAAVVSLLISKGARVNVSDKDHIPLHAAIEKNQANVVRLLLDAGAAVPKTDKQGGTLLHTTVLWGCEGDIVEMLVEAGATVDAKTVDREASFDLASRPPWERPPVTGRRTPLHFAAEKGNLAAAQALIARGADIHAQTTDGETPLSLTAREEVYEFDPWFQGTTDAVKAWNEQRRQAIETRNANRHKIAELIRQTEKSGRRAGSR